MDVILKNFARSPLLGQRALARPIRDQINTLLLERPRVVIDFRGVEATQSFTDELVGALVLEHGPDIVARLAFAGCSESMKGILTFVLRDRLHQQQQAKKIQAKLNLGPSRQHSVGHLEAACMNS